MHTHGIHFNNAHTDTYAYSSCVQISTHGLVQASMDMKMYCIYTEQNTRVVVDD
jgi:hypothetical protein